MNIENSLISTALLALQQSGELRFTINNYEDDKSGFWFKGHANVDTNDEFMVQILIYMDTEAPTGYGVSVEALDDEITLLDEQIKTFKEFQKIFHSNYIQNVFDAHKN